MNHNYIKRCKATIFSLSIILLAGCNIVSQSDNSLYEHIYCEEQAHLGADTSSPFCDFSIDYSYLNETDDSIAVLINRRIQQEFLGEEYATLTPETAVDSFKNTYLRNYKAEIGPIYQKDLSQTTSIEELPTWYNYTYALVTLTEEGWNGVINVTADTFLDTGGAHPNQWGRWLNFDCNTGKLIEKDDIFLPSAKTDIEQLLLQSLIQSQSEEYPEESISTLEDLQKLGFLQLTNMYIPDNFLLGKNGVSFLFNRYDIAPYSAGSIVLELSYEKIGPYLKQ